MGRKSLKNQLTYFIENIPDDKLSGFNDTARSNLVDNGLFRLDNQGLCTGNPKRVNLQVQANEEITDSIPSAKSVRGQTATIALVPLDDDGNPLWTPDEIRAELQNNRKF